MKDQHGHSRRRIKLHPVVMMLILLVLAMALTHVVPAGKFEHRGDTVVPGSYHVVPKINGLPALFATSIPAPTDKTARAAGLLSMGMSIPAGMAKSVALIFMVMFVGGMFGILRATGAIDAGVDWLLHRTSGNVSLLSLGLMLLVALGATLLGFISEYLVLVPVVMGVAQRLKLPNLYAAAVVIVPSMIGWAASVTNPLALTVVQPLAHVPIFSGLALRIVIFVSLLIPSLIYVLRFVRRLPLQDHVPSEPEITMRHTAVLLALVAGGTLLIVGTGMWDWDSAQIGAAFIGLGVFIALAGGLRPGFACDAFIQGMQGMLLAGMMLGLASSLEIMLNQSQIIDSIVQGFASAVNGHSRDLLVQEFMGAEMAFGLLVHSVMPKAAITLPIFAPIAAMAGISGQTIVNVLLLSSGLVNMVSPTNGLLLAFLAMSKVDYAEWIKFSAPLFIMLTFISCVLLYAAAAFGA
jgi:uncharacterized ion transporter superfamily protein YfcC